MIHQQIPLFERPPLNTVRQFKKALHKSAKSSRFSREQILDRMNEQATVHGINLVSNGRLKMDTFEKWLNPNDLSRQMPIVALPVFCSVVGDTSAMDVLTAPAGAMVIGAEDQKLLKFAKAYFKAKDANKIMRSIEKDLKKDV
jgi:hypothetical protein